MPHDDEALDVPQPAPPPAERPRYRHLSPMERTGSIAAGIAIAATGFVARFFTGND